MINDKETIALKVIDKWLNYKIKYSSIPGLQVCIRKKDKIIFNKAYGFANNKQKIPLTTEHLFHIASHSKTFTSCITLQLIQENKLTFTQPIIDILPELKNHKDKRFKNITIRDLLTHRSGLFRDGIDCSHWQLQKSFPSKEQFLSEILSSELIYDSNTNTKYSNYGYGILGLIIEKITGLSWEDALKKYILNKLNIQNVYPDFNNQIISRLAIGYSAPLKDRVIYPFKYTSANSLSSATGICANAHDTTLFFYEFLKGTRLINNEMQKELLSLNWPIMNTNNNGKYGLGVDFCFNNNIKFTGHGGSYPGFITETNYWIGTDYTISVFSNIHEGPVLNISHSISEIIEKVNIFFTDEEVKNISVSNVLMILYGAHLAIISSEKGLWLGLNTWSLSQSIIELEVLNPDIYVSHKNNGYSFVGEKLIFKRNAENIINYAKWGSITFVEEAIFNKHLKRALLQ